MTPAPNASADQVFDTFRQLAGGGSVGVADLARELQIPNSTAHRVLATAHDAGFADRDTSGTKYELGARAHALVHGLFRQYRIQRAAVPFLSRLARELGETTSLDVRVGWLAVRMAGFEGWNEIHAARRIGQTSPLATTAGGLAILAHLPEEQLDRYVRWEGGGRRSKARVTALRERLASVTASGRAREAEPHRDGAEIAFPVLAADQALAAISIDGNGSITAARPPAADVKRVRVAVGELEHALAETPELARDPFAHLDPDDLAAAAF